MTRARVLDLPVDTLDMEATVGAVSRMIVTGGVHQHVVLNASKVVQAQSDRELRKAIEGCDLVNADGMSVVWAGRLLGVRLPERVAGIDLMERLFAEAARLSWPVYLLGARREVVERVAQIEADRHPGLNVVGYRDGYWKPEEEAAVVSQIAATKPSILFVAMPSPKKEHFLGRHRDVLRVPFVMGVGGSFDVVAGVTSRAPAWMQKAGMEWLYRLIQEPRRMAARYVVGNTRFTALVCREWFRTRGARR